MVSVKRKVFATVLIAVIALSLASWYVLNHNSNENQTNDNETNYGKLPNVRILNFSHVNTVQWQPTFNFNSWLFNVTLVNLEAVNVSGITLVVRLETEETGISWNVRRLGTLYPQETQELQLGIAVGWSDTVYSKVATLVLGNVYLNTSMSEFLSLPILDEQALP